MSTENNVFDIHRRPTWKPVGITKVQRVGFCDYLGLYQDHHDLIKPLPFLNDGAYCVIDKEGCVVHTKLKKQRVEGSHESALFISCDGHRVTFDGNVSKFGRRDNVFGYPFGDALARVNSILASLGLPPFTQGERHISNFKGNPRSIWTGAKVTRVDMTENFATGSKEDCSAFMRYLAGQQPSRLKTGTHGDNETVHWGEGSRRVYSKAYVKSIELRKRGQGDVYVMRLADWCDEVGLVRFETTYKPTQLHAMGCHYLGGFDMRQLEIDFEERKQILTRHSATLDDLTALPRSVLGTLRMWQSGDAMSSLSTATFYRHRKALLPYGVDIAVKSNVVKFQPRTRVITLGPVVPPDFYELPPTIEDKHYANHR